MNSCLNRTYRLVWSEVHNAWVAVAETVRSRTKSSGRSARAWAVGLVAGLFGSSLVWAQLPTGGHIVGGAGTISSSGTTMTVTQTTDKMAANWQTFNIGKGNTVNFVQPNSHSVALNRVLGSDVSVIQGAINANGKVFLINPNGVLFTKDSHINVGAMVASTLNITTENFMAGNYRFEGVSSNAIVNQGNITAHGDGAAGGTVALIAAKIVNQGSITAHKGNVLMGAGSRVTLNLGGPVSIEVEQGALDALIEQGGAIKADGGLVYLTAKAAGDIVTTVINHTGITEAQTLATGESGKIYLMGDMEKGRVEVAGTLDASAPNGGEGGFIETSAARVAFAADLNVTTKATSGKTGQWLIDPVDFTVAATDGDITGNALGNLLANNSVKIQTATGTDSGTEQFGASGTNGDIFVNDSVTWATGNTLTLSAHRNIEINASISASHANGKLALEYGQGAAPSGNTATYTINAPVSLQEGTNFSTKLGLNGTLIDYTIIKNASGFQAINTDSTTRASNYALGSDISLQGVSWTPITNFAGRLEGLGNTVSGLTYSGLGDLGLFSTTALTGARSFSNLKISNFVLARQSSDAVSGSVGALLGKGGGLFTNITISNVSLSDPYPLSSHNYAG